MKLLEANGITKYYEGGKIIEDVSLFVNSGESVALLGASGVGKTTLFNILSGLEKCDEGKVFLKGKDVTNIPGQVGYMQQSDLLLPFKKIINNVMIPKEIAKCDKKEARKQAEEILEEFGLGEYKDMYPSQLSGGMRQRVALARTFMFEKELVLLDEPFSALDAITRSEMQNWFKETIKKHNMATLFITHDIDEALLLSDRIYVMTGFVGKITAEIEVSAECRVQNAELKEKIKDMVK